VKVFIAQFIDKITHTANKSIELNARTSLLYHHILKKKTFLLQFE
jgi:hypothetical protein